MSSKKNNINEKSNVKFHMSGKKKKEYLRKKRAEKKKALLLEDELNEDVIYNF